MGSSRQLRDKANTHKLQDKTGINTKRWVAYVKQKGMKYRRKISNGFIKCGKMYSKLESTYL
jgi:hypothetical protein